MNRLSHTAESGIIIQDLMIWRGFPFGVFNNMSPAGQTGQYSLLGPSLILYMKGIQAEQGPFRQTP